MRVKNEIIVGITCVICGNLILNTPRNRVYCKDCNKDKNKIKRYLYEIKRQQKRDYLKRTTKDKYVERLGTEDTSFAYQEFYGNTICRTNGEMDWEKEAKLIQKLKDKTFNKKSKLYTRTEGDKIRNIESRE